MISQVQQAGNNAFGPANCPGGTTYHPTWNLSGSFTVTTYTVQYWNGPTSTFGSIGSLTHCTGYEPQLWTMTIASGSYSTTVSTVIYDPQAPPVSGGSTPAKLVFLQPTSPGSGTINAAVSPQPIVAVEDTNGNIVYSDASSVTLTSSGPGSLSSNCSGVENQGIVSFSGCSFSLAGTYSLTAADSNASLTKATGASYTITTAPPAKVVFTTSPVTGTATANATLGLITIQEQDAFGNPDPGGADRQPHLELGGGNLRPDVRRCARHLGRPFPPTSRRPPSTTATRSQVPRRSRRPSAASRPGRRPRRSTPAPRTSWS